MTDIKRHYLSHLNELTALFNQNTPAYENFDGDYSKSRYGTQRDLYEMPEYVLDFSPYIELAKACGADCVSLKQSRKTGRLYSWNVNLAGHAPKLELRPVDIVRVQDLALMKRYHENWAYELGVDIDLDTDYEI